MRAEPSTHSAQSDHPLVSLPSRSKKNKTGQRETMMAAGSGGNELAGA